MKSALILILYLSAVSASVAMEPSKFEQLLADIGKSQFESAEKFLADQREVMKSDPEYFVILLNFALSKGQKAELVVAKGSPEKGEFGLSQKGKPVGFLGSRKTFDATSIHDAIVQTRAALSSFKSRLDIHLGILAAAERIKRWDIVGEQCVETLKISREIDNAWTWGPVGSIAADRKSFMLDNIQGRAEMLFQQDNQSADKALIDICNAMVTHYPESVYGYNNLGTLYLAKNDLTNAEKFLKQAERIDNHDEVVRSNLAKLNEIRTRQKGAAAR